MKNFLLLFAMLIVSMGLFSQQNAADIYVPGDQSVVTPPANQTGPRFPADLPANPVIYNNGPLVTHPGGGYGGADASAVQTSLEMSTYGFGHQILYDYQIADDFTVPAGGWDIAGIGFYAYQTGSSTTSTFTAMHFQILDGPPDNVGSTVVFGDLTTNRLTSSDFSGIYRVLDSDLTNNARPLMLNACMFDLHLDAGTYWVAWQADGTLGSGPWAPLVTILGQTTTGNAMQKTTDNWFTIQDGGTFTPQDFPFLIYGNSGVVPLSGWALLIGGVLIAATVFFRFRRM